MRKLSYLAALLLLSFVGCMQESNVTEPVSGINNQAKTIIMLPERADFSVESAFTSSQTINGASGGEIHLVKSYVSTSGNTVNIDCRLTIPASFSFADFRNITMQVSDEAGVDFFPSMTFDEPVILNYKITGLNLNGINPANVGFYYVDPSGNLIATVNEGVTVDVASGTLNVVNAQLPHFSRWAYAR